MIAPRDLGHLLDAPVAAEFVDVKAAEHKSSHLLTEGQVGGIDVVVVADDRRVPKRVFVGQNEGREGTRLVVQAGVDEEVAEATRVDGTGVVDRVRIANPDVERQLRRDEAPETTERAVRN